MRIVILLAFVIAAQAHAVESAASVGKRYFKLKDDADLYVGEGVAGAKDFGGDGLKALAAAKERARASLAAAVRVRIVSETREESKSGPAGSSESVESRSASMADVVLENVRYEDFIGFPEDGQVSSLAYVSKVDYRRQLAGKGVPVHVRESGVGIKGGQYRPQWLATLREKSMQKSVAPVLPTSKSIAAPSENALSMGVDVFWRSFILGFDWTNDAWIGYTYDAVAGGYKFSQFNVDIIDLSLGYDYAPWNWAIQPYLPLRLNGAILAYGVQTAPLFGASAGLGLRFWPNDSVSLDVSGLYYLGFNSVQLLENNGKTPLYMGPGQGVNADLSGTRGQIGISFSGF